MIINREEKISEITHIIQTRIDDINHEYRTGPSLHFYNRVIEQRKRIPQINDFLHDESNIELLYATLVSWDMNNRRAKMEDYKDFKQNLIENIPNFHELAICPKSREHILPILVKTNITLNLMKTKGKIVSNSKILHFIFPDICLPIDGRNTLTYLYGNTGESTKRFKEVLEFAYDIISLNDGWERFLDDNWNKSIPKLIDNAIILRVSSGKK